MNRNIKRILIISFILMIALAIPVVNVISQGIIKKINPNMSNAEYSLEIASAYGDIEGYHPKVLNFDSNWNGYKYWMAFTPYPHADQSKENPHILASNDMINWEEPKGYKNPLEPKPEGDLKKVYNSDTHLVYRKDLNRLECYWRYVDDYSDKVIIYRKYTIDGVNWSEKEISLESTRSKNDCISPAIIFHNNLYKMWYVDNGYVVKYRESSDGVNWTQDVKINVTYNTPDMKSWHLDVIHTENGYEMLMSGFKKGQDRNTMNLYYTKSKDNVNWDTCKVILKHSIDKSSWDNRGIYRSSFFIKDGIYYVTYSGISTTETRGIGVSYGKNIDKLEGLTSKKRDDFIKLITK
ncbi:hypothetical protein EXM65_10770 [Clostridium botulinum]|uniref:Uncharacterized protein n=1 Tax=Clostridium botulinum TaxID=1491 RepID=A0A6M0SQ30_CLOBO|nr:hypothetical protein [Clostridium botulinum]